MSFRDRMFGKKAPAVEEAPKPSGYLGRELLALDLLVGAMEPEKRTALKRVIDHCASGVREFGGAVGDGADPIGDQIGSIVLAVIASFRPTANPLKKLGAKVLEQLLLCPNLCDLGGDLVAVLKAQKAAGSE